MIEKICILIILLINSAYITLSERKILGISQRRKGPEKIGSVGILQPISDGVKLVLKENVEPYKGSIGIFIMSAGLSIIICIVLWYNIPISNRIIILDRELNIIYIMCITSINIYSVVLQGISSSSKYSIVGSIRSICQYISYEVYVGIMYIIILLLSNKYSLLMIMKKQIYIYNIFYLYPIIIVIILSVIVETNRPPADLAESESELVAGYVVEYSSISFAFIYLSEYSNIIILSMLCNALLLGNINILVIVLLYSIIIIRATLPRIKTNILLYIGWSEILPFLLCYFLVIFSIYSYLYKFPPSILYILA